MCPLWLSLSELIADSSSVGCPIWFNYANYCWFSRSSNSSSWFQFGVSGWAGDRRPNRFRFCFAPWETARVVERRRRRRRRQIIHSVQNDFSIASGRGKVASARDRERERALRGGITIMMMLMMMSLFQALWHCSSDNSSSITTVNRGEIDHWPNFQ